MYMKFIAILKLFFRVQWKTDGLPATISLAFPFPQEYLETNLPRTVPEGASVEYISLTLYLPLGSGRFGP